MKQKFLFLFVSILFPLGLLAQGEAAHWYFGYNSGIDFTNMSTVTNATINGITGQTLSGVPAFETGPISTGEGCFSISDKDGNFLFASDGSYVYNKNKALMPHGSGLKGNSSASQSGIVIPRPKHPDNFYIVTAPTSNDYSSRTYGLCYYEVDMTLDGGNGDVLGPYSGSTPTGTQLNLAGRYSIKDAYENIAAIGHANGIDYWLVHRCRNYFFVWLVTEDGINATPTYDYVIGENPGYHGSGYLKFSADGKYLACANLYHNVATNSIAIAEFDIASGIVSNINIMTESTGTTTYKMYGLAFSPNGEYLYFTSITSAGATNSQRVRRRSVASLLNGTAETAKMIISGDVSNVQMGPDNRLYGISAKVLTGANYRGLYIIPDPDDADPDVVIVPDYFPAANGSAYSLPTFTSSFFSASDIGSVPALPTCKNTDITFSVQIGTGSGENRVTKIEWNFGDGSPVEEDNDMNKYTFSKTHAYTEPGTYTLTLTPYKGDGSVLTDKMKTLEVKIFRCVMPVNPNIHIY